MAERTNPHANLIIGAQDEATPVFEQVGASAKRMADAVKGASEQAAKSSKQFNEELKGSKNEMQGLSDPAVPAAQTFDKATSSMIRQVQRLNAELEAGGARNAAYFEKMASVKGADMSALAPYLADLKKAEAAQRVATTGLDQMGMSAKQTAAALRQVPMQFTDIVVSLQGGQSAMQVFLQQGGQLKDMFGGVGAAARALGGYVLGLINPFTIAAAAIGAIALAYNQGSKEQDAFVKSIVTTGNISGVTAGQLGQYASAISSVAGTQSKAAETLAAFVAEGVRGGAMLEKYAQTAIEWEKATGQSVAKTAEQFASLQKDPLSSVLKLNEGTNFLTESVYKQIKALDEQGRSADASKVAMDALNTAMESRSKTIEQNLGYIERAWRGIASAAKKAWDEMLRVGRADSLDTQIDNIRAKIAQAKGQDKNRPFSMPWDTSLADLEKQLSYLTEQERMLRRGAEAEAERNKQLAARTEWDKAGEQYLSKRARMQHEIDKATNEAAAAGVEQAELEQRIASIREKFAEKNTAGMKAQRAAAKLLAEDMAALAKMAGLSPDFYKEWDKLNDMFKRGKLDVEGLTEAQAELLKKQPVIAAETKAQADAQNQVNASIDAYRSALQAVAKEEAARVDGIAKSNADLREQIATMGLTNQQIRQRTIELNLATIAEKERQLARLQSGYTNTREQAALEEEIRLLKERNGLLSDQGVKEQYVAAQQEMTDTWTSIDRTAHDVFVNIFEDGAGTFKRLGQTLKAALLDMLYQMTVKRWIINIGASMGVTGGIFGAGQAMAGQGGSALGVLGNVGSVGNWLSGGSIGSAIFGNSVAYGAMVPGLSMGGTQAAMLAAQTGEFGLAGATATASAGGAGAGGFGALLSNPVTIAIGALAMLGLSGAFSRKHEQHNLQGTFGGATGFEGNWHDYYRGGLFRSSKTVDTPLEADFLKGLQDAWNAQEAAVTSYAQALGLATDSIAGFTYDVNIKLKDLDPKAGDYQQQLMARVADAIKAGSNEMAQQLIGSWDTVQETVTRHVQQFGDDGFSTVEETIERRTYKPSEFARDGEQAIDTLTRLATSLQGVNALFDTLGLTLYEASLKGGDMASQLADAAGGLDKLQATTASYFQNFYTGSEQHATALRQLQEQMKTMGVETIPYTREQFRALVESLDLTTEEGRKLFAGLMDISGAFAAVTPELFQAGQTLSDAITQGLLGTFDGDNLGAYMAQTVSDGIYNAIAGYFAQQITDIVVSGVVDPIIQAAVTGASITGAVSQATIDEMVAHANAVAAAASAVLNDPALREALSGIGRAVSSISMPAQRGASSVASYTRAVSDSGDAASRAADSVNDAWKSIGDSLIEQARRIRGEMADAGQDSLSYWQAQFALTTAAARAGDIEAAQRLSGISESLLRAASTQASSMLELQRIRAAVAQSLQETGAYAATRGGGGGAGGGGGGGGQAGGVATPVSRTLWEQGVYSPGGIAPWLVGTLPPAPSAELSPISVPTPRLAAPDLVPTSDPALTNEIRELRETLTRQGQVMQDLQLEWTRVIRRWDSEGMPTERVD